MRMTISATRPFTSRVNEVRTRKHLRYTDLASGCLDARSSAWFNHLCNASTPWEVNPPGDAALAGLARLLEVNTEGLREMIAQEWYGVGRAESLSPRVQSLRPTLEALEPEDFARIEDLALRLSLRVHVMTSQDGDVR